MAGEGLGFRFPLDDGIGKVVLLDCMGDDLSIVNDAKQSYDRHVEQFGEKEQNLLSFLLNSNHTSPLRGAVLRFHVKAPLFVARQWWKHTVACTYVDDQLGWNEKSFRYCLAKDNEYYYPSVFRQQSANNKQARAGSSANARFDDSSFRESDRNPMTVVLRGGVGR